MSEWRTIKYMRRTHWIIQICKILIEKPQGSYHFRHVYMYLGLFDYIKGIFKEKDGGFVNWIQLKLNMAQWRDVLS
jgi:hypothetical protein